MTKEELIPIALGFYRNNSIDPNSLNKLINEFIIDKDEGVYNKIKDYIPVILNLPMIMMDMRSYIDISLKHFINKLNIYTIYKDNKLITLY